MIRECQRKFSLFFKRNARIGSMISIIPMIFLIICTLCISHSSKAFAFSAESPAQPKILVFVSSSMPETSLVQWIKEARALNPHAALIMRGFVHDSLPDTRVFVLKLVKDSGGKGGVSIDPVLFKKYGIERVPAVVVETGNEKNTNFDVVYGNTSLSAALEVIAEKGDNALTIKKLLAHNGDAHD